MAIKNEYKQIIMDEFRKTKSRPGHVIPLRRLQNGIMRSMNREEQQDFIDSINGLQIDGFIECPEDNNGFPAIRLTPEGYDELYPPVNKLGLIGRIMDEFRKQDTQIGQVIPLRHFRFTFEPQLTPKEEDAYEGIINDLIDKRWIGYQKEGLECFVLLRNGYDYIHGK